MYLFLASCVFLLCAYTGKLTTGWKRPRRLWAAVTNDHLNPSQRPKCPWFPVQDMWWLPVIVFVFVDESDSLAGALLASVSGVHKVAVQYEAVVFHQHQQLQANFLRLKSFRIKASTQPLTEEKTANFFFKCAFSLGIYPHINIYM